MPGKKYAIHDNGGVPFYEEVKGTSVTVWKNMDEYEIVNKKFVDIPKSPKALFTINAKKIYIGKKSPNAPPTVQGNSILLFLETNKYRYIGSEIYDFVPVKGDTIEKYYSNIYIEEIKTNTTNFNPKDLCPVFDLVDKTFCTSANNKLNPKDLCPLLEFVEKELCT